MLAACDKCGATRIDQQLGLESTPEEYVTRMVEVFREVRRVLAAHGTVWLNLGDSYASGGAGNTKPRDEGGNGAGRFRYSDSPAAREHQEASRQRRRRHESHESFKPKDLVGIPWSLAKALQAPYYTGKISDEKDRVWLAATLDAEGTICGFRHQRKDDGRVRTGVHVTITNSNRALLDNAQRIWPTTRVDHNAHGDGHLGGLPTWRWIAHDVDEKSLLMRELYPYLIAKKKQAFLAYNLLEMSKVAKRSARTEQADEIRGRRDWIVGALSRLNHAEDVDIPSWCEPPEGMWERGWFLRSEIIWAKPNPMPESVTDRPTKAHEYVFLLSKQPRYYFDAEAVREKAEWNRWGDQTVKKEQQGTASWIKPKGKNELPRSEPQRDRRVAGFNERWDESEANGTAPTGRNIRSVWEIATQPYPEAHFATFPEELARRCIAAGTSERGKCPECGAPWVREMEVGESSWQRRLADGDPQRYGLDGNRTKLASLSDSADRAAGGFGVPAAKTAIGWSPSCNCLWGTPDPGSHLTNPPPIPCVVLDPFIGSGTVAHVARKLGRHAIGIDLNESYLELAARRLQQQSLFTEASGV